jgi:hypothetical protein
MSKAPSGYPTHWLVHTVVSMLYRQKGWKVELYADGKFLAFSRRDEKHDTDIN